jgi:hypothetical protein
MFRLPKTLMLQLIFLFWTASLLAQAGSNDPFIPSILPPGPNAATLLKFSEVPVSPYTGTADVTVPIYAIKAKGISIPIDLAYHTGGIRIKEESGWVGLGWVLNAGGSISRTIMDQDDFGTMPYKYLTTGVPQPVGDLAMPQPTGLKFPPAPLDRCFYDFFCNYLVNSSSGNYDYRAAFTTGVQTYDMEPDIFSYNFHGHSGKFILTRTGQVVMQKQENIKIQFQGTGVNVTFTITDDQGNNFYFNTTETTQTVGAATPISTWLISKIVTQQQDSILFNYAAGGGSFVKADINQYYNTFCTASQQSNFSQGSPTIYNDETLQNIQFNDGQLNFYFDNKRKDLLGGNKLDSVVIYSKASSGALTYLKQDNFYYTYFNGAYNNLDTLECDRLRLDSVKEKSTSGTLPPYAFAYNNTDPGSASAKHGYSIDHWGFFNNAPNTGLIPSMNTVYAPPAGSATGIEQFVAYKGANRLPVSNWMTTFSLQQITYPTGGKTIFAYEPNDYDFYQSNGGSGFQDATLVAVDTSVHAFKHGTTSGTINLNTLFPVEQNRTDPANLTINIAFRYQINNDSVYKNSTGKIYFSFTYDNITVMQDINSAVGSPNSPVFSVSIPITFTNVYPPGICNWSVYIDPTIDTVHTFSDVTAVYEYQETQQAYDLLENNSVISPASGLRIHSITNYKDANVIASEKIYSYTYSADKLGTGNPQTYTYGRIMEFPSYARYAFTVNSDDTRCWGLSLFSSSNTSTTSVTTGNIVGYDQVTERTIDPLTGVDIGKTVYNYFNASDTPVAFCSGMGFPGGLNMGNNLNGLLLSKTEYSDYGGIYSPVTQTNYYYHTTNRSVYFSPKYAFIHYTTGLDGSLCTTGTAVENEVNASFYPSIKSERVLLDSAVSIVYDQKNPALFALTRNANYYDNARHYQITRSSSIDSRGDTLISKIKYPQDYIPSGQTWTGNTILDSLIGRNMVGETIETQDSLYYPGSSAGYIVGSQLSLFRAISPYNTIVPDRTYKLAINAPVTNFQPFAISENSTSQDSRYRQMVSFDQYDSYNNLVQFTPVDQNAVTFVWDYKHIYPIAQVKNAASADVAATSFEADGTGGWTIAGGGTNAGGITGNNSHSMNSSTISKSGLTSANTYIVSYWTSNGSAYSIAGTVTGYPIQGKRISGWTYFEHKITGQTSVSITGTGNIDELRLYPATAQMTTYTYSPLVGTSTTCDVDNKVTYYFYDAYQRLKWIKDQDGNIIKTIQYHYANQSPSAQ